MALGIWNFKAMQLHQLARLKNRSHRRVGRGGKRGSYSGRGIKGQKSRSGRVIRPALRDLILRIPKRRGFRNKPKSDKPRTISLADLIKKIKPLAAGSAKVHVNKEMLRKIGLLSLSFRGDIKILGKGEVPFALTLEDIAASKGVIAAIEKAGGRITNVHQ